MTYLKAIITDVHGHSLEMVTAELSDLGFEAFEETEEGIDAYIPSSLFDHAKVKGVLLKYGVDSSQHLVIKEVDDKNWNEEWESNFKPVIVADRILVRATFHQSIPPLDYEIIIDPKMSFGTGHHETTHMMLEAQLCMDHQGKKVLDIGTGTGILSILACKKGASQIDATDIDEWSISNCQENFGLNGVQNHRIHHGAIKKLTLDPPYDIILANINKNIIMSELELYAQHIKKGGVMLLSGFLDSDVDEISDYCTRFEFELASLKKRNHWACLTFKKNI